MITTGSKEEIISKNVLLDDGNSHHLVQLLRKCPPLEDLKSNLEKHYIDQNQCDVPQASIALAVKRVPAISKIFIDLTSRLHSQERWETCSQILRAVVAGDPECVEAWNDLGVVAFTRFDYHLARQCFEEAQALHPYYGESLLNLTALYLAVQNPHRAVKIALKSLQEGCGISPDLIDEIAGMIGKLSPTECAEHAELQGDLLYYQFRYKKTHKENHLLNRFEIENNISKVRSYPLSVYLNMSNVCNVNCGFCVYNPETQTFRDFVTLKDIQKMTWLRYVKRFGIWTGVGDSLVNSEFREIYLYLIQAFPHLEITLSTNGLALNDQLANDFSGTLNTLNVSLNAATAETYHKVMNRNHFDKIIRKMKAVVDAKRKTGAEKPYTVFSYVICKENLRETTRFVEICHELGVDLASFKYFISPIVKGRSKIGEESSCYRMKEESDAYMKKAYQRGAELGVQIKKAPFLAEENDKKSSVIQPTCTMPWTECHLNPAENNGKRQMFFCCTGLTKGVPFDKSKLDPENFMKVWNHQNAQYIRATVNSDEKSSACGFCLNKDWADPDSQDKYDRAKMK